MRETFGLLFLLAACALAWAQTALFAADTSGDVIVIKIALTFISYIFAYAGSGGRTNKIMKRVLTFIGGIQCLIMLVVIALSITGYVLQISNSRTGFYYPVRLCNFMSHENGHSGRPGLLLGR